MKTTMSDGTTWYGPVTRVYSSPVTQHVTYQNSGFPIVDGIDLELQPGDSLELTAPLLVHDWLMKTGNSQLRHPLDSQSKATYELEVALNKVLIQLADLATITGEACARS